MSQFPVYTFNEDTDYAEVLKTNQRMYSYLNSNIGCCKGKSLTEQLCIVDRLLQATYIDGNVDVDLHNEDRWKADIKAAYLLLYKLV